MGVEKVCWRLRRWDVRVWKLWERRVDDGGGVLVRAVVVVVVEKRS